MGISGWERTDIPIAAAGTGFNFGGEEKMEKEKVFDSSNVNGR